jgi:hypothetical protein
MDALDLVAEVEQLKYLFCNHFDKTSMNIHHILYTNMVKCGQGVVIFVSTEEEDMERKSRSFYRNNLA